MSVGSSSLSGSLGTAVEEAILRLGHLSPVVDVSSAGAVGKSTGGEPGGASGTSRKLIAMRLGSVARCAIKALTTSR